jgi:hypothetical protein
MKRLIILVTLSAIGLVFLLFINMKTFDRNSYVSQKVLDTARPLDVSIDVEFLRKLVPAYEQQ